MAKSSLPGYAGFQCAIGVAAGQHPGLAPASGASTYPFEHTQSDWTHWLTGELHWLVQLPQCWLSFRGSTQVFPQQIWGVTQQSLAPQGVPYPQPQRPPRHCRGDVQG